ncbi:hypothetical protein CIL05_12720 [Virgibacillus profundi]|uniref:Uncharacterized protein n=1 Tax=Virgibacillus profundi TaxID=2024555 RepID=A0A2A2IDU5_9BACI|nr:hypothetical protein [Virgibacillus profundi]PAV29253.1 hypothetical protein CIL05_12720 [Virgibacillus profundi]PXY53422.1 hypothetical protein CIT14_12845 [Virgibacillus profundi]
MSVNEKTREEIMEEITQQEIDDKAFITGTMAAIAEMFVEGILPDKENYKKLDKAIKLMDEYGMTNEELGIYIEHMDPAITNKVKQLARLVFRNKGVKV